MYAHSLQCTSFLCILFKVGKSSFINSLVRKHAFRTYPSPASEHHPTTTSLPQEIAAETPNGQIRFIDTPGLMVEKDPSDENATALRAHDIIMRNRGKIEKLKDPTPVGE
jgi:nuclear GTP-binding protein